MRKKALFNPKILPWLFILPALILILVFYLYPIIQTLLISFKDYNILNPANNKFVGTKNFARMMDDRVLALSLRNTLVYVIVTLTLQFLLGFTLALLLWKNFKGRGIYQAFVFVPWAVAGFLIGIMFRWMFNAQYGVFSDLLSRLGFMDSGMSILSDPKTALWGPIIGCVWYGVPYFAIMILSALQGVSSETIEAAHVDGAGAAVRLFKVIIPAIKPTILITLLLRVIWVFNSADIIYVMTNGGPVNASHTIASYLFQLAYTKHDYSLVCAVSITIMIALMIYSVIYLKVSKFEEAGEI